SSAVSADKDGVLLVEGPSQTTRGTAYSFSAIPAVQNRCVPLAIEKQQCGLSSGDPLSQGVYQLSGQDLAGRVPQVDDSNRGSIAGFSVGPCRRKISGGVHRMYGGMTRGEQQDALQLSGAFGRDNARIISRGVLGLVCRVVLLVDED